MAAVQVALLAEGVDRNFLLQCRVQGHPESPSSRRAWIEIENQRNRRRLGRSPSSRRAWIEIRVRRWKNCKNGGSPSSRRAWIEIVRTGNQKHGRQVALLAEGVDRNIIESRIRVREVSVALLAEGVDRNHSSVGVNAGTDKGSPSSRRAWIEIIGTDTDGSSDRSRPPRGGRG